VTSDKSYLVLMERANNSLMSRATVHTQWRQQVKQLLLTHAVTWVDTCSTYSWTHLGYTGYTVIWHHSVWQQVGQLSQTNRAATWAISGKNRTIGLSAKSVHLTHVAKVTVHRLTTKPRLLATCLLLVQQKYRIITVVSLLCLLCFSYFCM